eukprot:2064302-Alexandrium_andersonii.AAC.1
MQHWHPVEGGEIPILDDLPFRNDSDLWACARSLLEQRTATSARVMKVKGHLEASAITDGKITQRDWEGNAKADAAADRAHGPETQWHC